MKQWIISERIKEPGWELPLEVIRDQETGDLVCEIPYPDQPEHLENAALIVAAPVLADLRERLNALITRHNPQAWGKDLVTAAQDYIAELLRRRRADNDVFYRLFEDHHIVGLSLADVQEMRKKRFEEIVKESGE